MPQEIPSPSLGSPLSADLSLLDRWVVEERHVGLRNALLELRAACAGERFRPLEAVRRFLRVRPLMRRRSYWSQHRVRRLLERHIEVEVTTPGGCRRQPLVLNHATVSRVLDAVRREVFEEGTVDWDRIRVRLVPTLN